MLGDTPWQNCVISISVLCCACLTAAGGTCAGNSGESWFKYSHTSTGWKLPTCFTRVPNCRDPLYAGAGGYAASGVAPGPAVSETLLRMQYAMAVIRVVNGIADSAQKGKVATSVASLASFAGDNRTHALPSA